MITHLRNALRPALLIPFALLMLVTAAFGSCRYYTHGSRTLIAMLGGQDGERIVQFTIEGQQRTVICTDRPSLDYLEKRILNATSLKQDPESGETYAAYEMWITFERGAPAKFRIGPYINHGAIEFGVLLLWDDPDLTYFTVWLEEPRPKAIDEMMSFLTSDDARGKTLRL